MNPLDIINCMYGEAFRMENEEAQRKAKERKEAQRKFLEKAALFKPSKSENIYDDYYKEQEEPDESCFAQLCIVQSKNAKKKKGAFKVDNPTCNEIEKK
jgi:hypothetical protein